MEEGRIKRILKEYWGHEEFRPLQEDIILSALAGNDTLALLPTGSGKSVCFQVPALAQDGICLVISPLIALMKDQVQQLRKKGISALALHTGMSYKEVMKTLELTLNEKVKLLYVSPERIQTRLFRDFLPSLPISLVAVDEAHCVSQWGYDFRPSYLKIASLRESLPEVPILALTASATPMVQADIVQQLQLRKPTIIRGSFEREALSYSCFEEDNKLSKLTTILQQVSGCGIVYCKSRKRTVDVCRHLQEKGIPATYYHAGLDQEDRHERQHLWTSNQVRVIVSTNAFGMGIDKPDVRTVVHYDVPDCLENYYQEAGRAGRDRQKAFAVLLYNQQELDELQSQLEKKFPTPETIRNVYQAVADFLQIPSGMGEGNSYDFDLTLFCNNFHFDRVTAINALQTLQAEGYCALNESVFIPPRVQFTCDRHWLETIETQHPDLEPLITTMLRHYEGIFSYPAIISELSLARLLRKDKEAIRTDLQKLHYYGIIRYEALKDQPQLLLLTERVKATNIRIDQAAFNKRKELARERLKQFQAYIRGTQCRSSFIGKYFGDENIHPCGICDNCLKQKKKQVSTHQLSTDILELLNDKARSAESVKKQLPYPCDDEAFRKAVTLLQAEQLIIISMEGELKRRT